MKYDLESLRIVHYPDPCLRKKCAPVTAFDTDLAALADRMLALMMAGKGVGLAAPQVGVLERIFVMSHTCKPEDARVLVNPVIREPAGMVEAEEGCLSIPGVHVQVRRAQHCRIVAQDVSGKSFEFEAADLIARICQHETDHLNGVLILDKMGPTDRIATKSALKALEAQYRSKAGARR